LGDKPTSIRHATDADATAIQHCVKAAYHSYIERLGRPPGPMLDDYARVVQQHHTYVVELDGKIVGLVVLIEQENGILLDNVAVDPAYQGKGIGRLLIDFAETKSRELGYQNLDLYTHELMTENIDMYKGLGYSETDRRTEKGFQRVYMRKVV